MEWKCNNSCPEIFVIFANYVYSDDWFFVYIKQQQWNQLLLLLLLLLAAAKTLYFYLSCKDQMNLQHLQIFERVRMIVTDALLRYTLLNDLLYYFMVFIFILSDILPTETQETKIIESLVHIQFMQI